MLDNKVTQFSLEGREYIELNNLLKVTGICSSGGEAKTTIADGNVKVDGEVECRKRCKLRINQLIEINNLHIIIKP